MQQYSDLYITNVLGMQIPLMESAGFNQRVLIEQRKFERAMRIDESFFKGLGKSAIKVKKLFKVLKSVIKDPKKIMILVESLASQLKSLATKLFNFVDAGIASLGFLRSILAPAKTKFNELFSTGLKSLEGFVTETKKWAGLGLKKFKQLKGYQKVLFGIGLIIAIKEIYEMVKNYYEPIMTAVAEAISVWTADDSVLAALKLSKELDEGEFNEATDYDPKTHIKIILTDGKPLIMEKKFWQSKEFKKIIEACKKSLGVAAGKFLEKFAIEAITAAATGGLSKIVKLCVITWKVSKTLAGVLDVALDRFIKEDSRVAESILRKHIRNILIESRYGYSKDDNRVIKIKDLEIRIDIDDMDYRATQHSKERQSRHRTGPGGGYGISSKSIREAISMALGDIIDDYANGELKNNERFLIVKSSGVSVPLNIVGALNMRKGPDDFAVITVMRKQNFLSDLKTYEV